MLKGIGGLAKKAGEKVKAFSQREREVQAGTRPGFMQTLLKKRKKKFNREADDYQSEQG